MKCIQLKRRMNKEEASCKVEWHSWPLCKRCKQPTFSLSYLTNNLWNANSSRASKRANMKHMIAINRRPWHSLPPPQNNAWWPKALVSQDLDITTASSLPPWLSFYFHITIIYKSIYILFLRWSFIISHSHCYRSHSWYIHLYTKPNGSFPLGIILARSWMAFHNHSDSMSSPLCLFILWGD